MLLAIDIGNSAIKFGVFDGERLLLKFSTPTDRGCTASDLEQATAASLKPPFESAIACSVVPKVDNAMREFISERLGVAPRFLDNTFDFGLTIKYETVSTLGTDRLVNAFAAVSKYKTPVVVCSLGTATTIDFVNETGEYLGGAIAPGLPAMTEALHLKTANLPVIEVTKPESVIGTSTIASIRSGLFYGYASMVDGMIRRMAAAAGSPPAAKAVATGGYAELIASECPSIDIIDTNLLLDGLRLAHERT